MLVFMEQAKTRVLQLSLWNNLIATQTIMEHDLDVTSKETL